MVEGLPPFAKAGGYSEDAEYVMHTPAEVAAASNGADAS